VFRYLERLDDELYGRIMDKKNRLDSAGKLSDENLDRVEKMLEAEYIYNTNKMEGNTLTKGETDRILRGMTVSGKPLGDRMEIKNNPASIEFIKDLAFNSAMKEITQQDILDVHRIGMAGVISDAGKYRENDDIFVKGAEFMPSPWYEIPSHMDDLLDFVNDNPDGLSPIEVAAHAHFWFASIHPFSNGNGRTARLLTNLILLRNHYPFIVFHHVEKEQYRRLLNKADNGSFKPFLIYIARLAEQAIDLILQTMDGSEVTELLSLIELAKGTPYNHKYLKLQASKGIIDAIKKDGKWMTTRKIIDKYIEYHGRKKKLNG
jgi:Fic family protein